MPGKYFAVLVISLYTTICDGSTSPLVFPQCDQPLHKVVRVNSGGNATLRLRLLIVSYDYHWERNFTWVTDKGITLCNFSRGGSCRVEINNLTQFYTAMTGEKTNHYSSCTDYINYVDLELTIVRASQCDECIYYLHSDIQSSCLILNVTIDVQDMIPLCNASLLDGNKFVNLSCKWFPRAYGDRMQLLVRNQTMQSFEFEPPTKELGAVWAWNATTVISATISTQDMFDNRIPDVCIVSNPTMGFEDQCNFELFMSPLIRKISDKRSEIIFTCCTETDEVPSFWWYFKNTELRPVDMVGQLLKLHINDSNLSSSASNELVALICGKEMHNGLVLYGIGELANNLYLTTRMS